MKTDLIEIFQTVRASLQPYASMGFDNRTNSETVYDLWSNKNVKIGGEEKHEVFFASVNIEKTYVTVCLLPEEKEASLKDLVDPNLIKLYKKKSGFQIKELDDFLLKHIEDSVAACYKLYKEEAWV
ncbi:hypothetical protein ACXZ1K_10380 [Pedobacter sp. PWIIR3]